jgi:two-component system, sensor histidine kinase and response regulator
MPKENNQKSLELPHFLSIGLFALVLVVGQFFIQAKLISFSKPNVRQSVPSIQGVSKQISRLEFVSFAASLFALLVISMFILRPQELKIRKALEDALAKEKDLTKKKEAAEFSDKVKNEFLSAISYEMRTPVNGMLGMTSLLLDTNLNEEQRDYVVLLNKSTDSVLNIINDISDLTKIEAGQLSLDQSYFDFRSIVEDTTDLLSVKTEEKDIELVVSYDLYLPRYLIGDPYRIRQILSNLVGKTIEIARKGSVIVNVNFEQKSDYKVDLKLEIEAINSSIPAEKLEKAFDKFVQIDDSDEQDKGDGLSLAITKQLVELMKGKISIVSEPDKGSKFFVNIPLILDRDAPNNVTSSRKGNLPESRVLLLADNKFNNKVIQKHLSNMVLDNSLATSDEDAIKELNEALKEGDPYRIMIVDLHMLHLDLDTFFSNLKSDPDLRNLKVILLASLGRRTEAKNIIQSLEVDASLLMKPLKPVLLLETLASYLESSAKETSVAKQAEPKGARVLVVEDNLVNQKVAVCMLEKLGCKVDAASNGKRALELLKAYPYEVIFMDCQMPEMDGYQATIEIRRLYDSERHISIIAMTANAMQGDREKCFQVGMDGYISKPIKLEDLKDALKYCVNKTDLPVIEFPSLEPSVLEALRSLKDEKFLEEIFQTFLRNTSDTLAVVSKAIYEEDIQNLKSAAQNLKGASVDIGAKRIAEICQNIESLNDLSTNSKTAALIAATQLNREYRRVKGEIEAQLEV